MKILAIAALLGGLLSPAQAEEPVSCAPPDPFDMGVEDHYDFAMIYKSECASRTNWGRDYEDVTISSDGLSVTASTALAGAIASVKYRDQEYIGSGGHGAAFQWAVRPYVRKIQAPSEEPHPTECYNPTQAGSQYDDRNGQKPPFHGPSTSALSEFRKTSATSYRAASRLAMYVPHGDIGYQECKAAEYQDLGPVAGEQLNPMTMRLSRYWLNPDVSVNGNVIKLHAGLHVEDAEPAANLNEVYTTVVAYSQHEFTKEYAYVDGHVEDFVNEWPHKKRPLLRCTDDGLHCLGMWWDPKKFPVDTVYAYQESHPPADYNAWGGEYVIAVNFKSVAQRHVDMEAYAIVGTMAEVKTTLDRLSAPTP